MSIFRCNVPHAVPCVRTKTHGDKGELLPKPIKTFKSVKKGQTVSWVDLCSRKHFTALDDGAKKLNREDFKKMKEEFKGLGIDLPGDVTFAECADSLAALKSDKSNSNSNAKRRFFTPKTECKEKEPTNAELKAR